MKTFTTKRKLVFSLILFIIILLIFSVYIFGWGGKSIDIINFETDDVEKVVLYCTKVDFKQVTVTKDTEIQYLIESINKLQHTGKNIKNIFKYGIGVGGSFVYEFNFHLTNGEIYTVCFYSNIGDQPIADMEMSYQVNQNKKGIFADTCRGSMEFFYELTLVH